MADEQGISSQQEATSRAAAITEQRSGRDHPDMAGLLNNLGNLLRGLGNSAEAEACYRDAIAIGAKAFGRRTHRWRHPRLG
jgi:hypothetical protein